MQGRASRGKRGEVVIEVARALVKRLRTGDIPMQSGYVPFVQRHTEEGRGAGPPLARLLLYASSRRRRPLFHCGARTLGNSTTTRYLITIHSARAAETGEVQASHVRSRFRLDSYISPFICCAL